MTRWDPSLYPDITVTQYNERSFVRGTNQTFKDMEAE